MNSSTLYTIGVVNVPADSGTNTTTAATNLLLPSNLPGLPIDSDGNPYIILISGDQLQVTLGAAISSPNVATFVCMGGDF